MNSVYFDFQISIINANVVFVTLYDRLSFF